MIPAFSISNVLPPFQGDDPANPVGLSPYPTDMYEIAQRFGITEERRSIISGLIAYRKALIEAGFVVGIQWLDGSFCENVEVTQNRPPNDIDLVTLAYRPIDKADAEAFGEFIDERPDLFDPDVTKDRYKVDAYLIDLSVAPHLVVSSTVYWYGLFSHQRNTHLWKGMLQLALNDSQTDAVAEMML